MPESLSRSVQTDLSDSAMDRRSFLRTGLGGAMFLGTVSEIIYERGYGRQKSLIQILHRLTPILIMG